MISSQMSIPMELSRFIVRPSLLLSLKIKKKFEMVLSLELSECNAAITYKICALQDRSAYLLAKYSKRFSGGTLQTRRIFAIRQQTAWAGITSHIFSHSNKQSIDTDSVLP